MSSALRTGIAHETTRSANSANNSALQGAKSIQLRYQMSADCMSDRRQAMKLESQVPDPPLSQATPVLDTERTIFDLLGFPKGNLGQRP